MWWLKLTRFKVPLVQTRGGRGVHPRSVCSADTMTPPNIICEHVAYDAHFDLPSNEDIYSSGIGGTQSCVRTYVRSLFILFDYTSVFIFNDMSTPPHFSRQVLYGCVRYKDALRVFLKHYYNDMASSVLRGDFTLYMVLGYLLLFRLDELGFGDFRRLTSSEDPTKMAQLLNYLIDWERVEVLKSSETAPYCTYGCKVLRTRSTNVL